MQLGLMMEHMPTYYGMQGNMEGTHLGFGRAYFLGWSLMAWPGSECTTTLEWNCAHPNPCGLAYRLPFSCP